MTAQAVPALPSVFRGCWQGQVSELDWIRSEPGAHKIGFWTPKNYRLCYKRVGNQPFTLTFTEELAWKICGYRCTPAEMRAARARAARDGFTGEILPNEYFVREHRSRG